MLKKLLSLLLSMSILSGLIVFPQYNAFAALPPSTPVTSEVKVPASADAHVRSGSYGNNKYGGETTIEVRNFISTNYMRKAFVKFDVSNRGLDSVEKAILRLYCSELLNMPSVTAAVYEVSDDSWTETGITWNTMPVIDALINSVNITGPGWYEWDVTSYVTSQFSGDKVVTLAIDDNTLSGAHIKFSSKEAGSNSPELVLTGIPSATPTPTLTATPTPTLTPTPSPTPIPAPPANIGIYEAEEARLENIVSASVYSGYTGAGYVKYEANGLALTEWSFNSAVEGKYDLEFNYALETGSNSLLKVYVNSVELNPPMTFSSTGNWSSWQYSDKFTAVFRTGINTIKLVSQSSEGPAVDHLKVTYLGPADPVTQPPTGAVIYEAEKAFLKDTVIDSIYPLYSGTGYVSFSTNPGEYIEWVVSTPKSGYYNLGFKYANKYDNDYDLKINGISVQNPYRINTTGGYTSWRVVYYNTYLEKGNNNIRLISIGDKGGSVDKLELMPAEAGQVPTPAPIAIPEPVKDYAQLSPRTANYDQNTQRSCDIKTTIKSNGNTLAAIKNGEAVLKNGTDYTVYGNEVIIKKEYLAQFNSGTEQVLTFDFTPGADAKMYIQIIDTTGTRIVNVLDYGAVNNKTILSKDAFNNAINDVSAQGGGIVDVPPGEYLVASIRLKSNVTLNIQPGATLWASLNVNQNTGYVSDYDSKQKKVIYGYDCSNVKITGGGKIIAQATGILTPKTKDDIVSQLLAQFESFEFLPNYLYSKDTNNALTEVIKFDNVQGVVIENIQIEDSPKWTIQTFYCDNVKISGVSINNSIFCGGNDGMDIVACRDVTIKHCDISTSDDAIVIKATFFNTSSRKPRASYNIYVEDCIVASCTSGLKIGTETEADISNVTFKDSKVYNPSGGPGPEAGIAIEMVDGHNLSDVTVQNIQLQNVRGPVFVKLGNRNKNADPSANGTLKNVLIENISGTSKWNNWYIPSSVSGYPGNNVQNVTLRNIDLVCEGYGTEGMAEIIVAENSTKYPKPQMMGELPAYGFYLRHVDGVTMENVSVKWRNNDYRPMIVSDDVRNITIDNCNATNYVGSKPLYRLINNGDTDVTLTNLVAPVNTKTFIEILGGLTDNILIKGNDMSNATTPISIGTDVPPGEVITSQPPIVSITSPLANTLLTAPANITVQASAYDSDGTIARIEFYNGIEKLGEDMDAPYEYSWTNISAGTYNIKAKAVDNDENISWSDVIPVSIVNNSNSGGGSDDTAVIIPEPSPLPVPAPTPLPRVVDGRIEITSPIVENGTVNIEVPAADLEKALEQVKDSSRNVVVEVSKVEGVSKVVVKLPVQPIEAVETKQLEVISVNTSVANISVTADALKKDMKNDSKAIEISAELLESSKLPANLASKVGLYPVYDLNIYVDGNKVSKQNGNRVVEVSIAYDLKPGDDPNKVVVYHLNHENSLKPEKNSQYNSSTGRIEFTTNNLGKYTVMYRNISFSDLSEALWAKDIIETLAAREIIDGIGEGMFAPNANVTRAQFIKMLIDAFDLLDETAKSSLKDVQEGAWYYSSVASAQKLGIVEGYSDGSFGVNNEITRQEMAVMAYRAALVAKIQLQENNLDKKFDDEAEIAGYAKDAVRKMHKGEIIDGMTIDMFMPGNRATRAQAAKIVYKLLMLIKFKEA